MHRRTSRGRLGPAAVVGLGAVLVFAALGGAGLAGPGKPEKAQYGQYQNANKVTVCHKDKVTIRIAAPAVGAHEAHGDVVGACASTFAATASKPKKEKGNDAAENQGESTASAAAKPGNGNGNGNGKK
jgi:hypothetical protein